MATRSLYLINPRTSVPTYFGAEAYEAYGLPPAQSMADLATTTVAAMVPRDWEVEICDEFVSPIDFDREADFIGITGKITQIERMLEVADDFRRRGQKVVIGGPCASLSPEHFRGRCDVLVIGELEDLAEELQDEVDRIASESEEKAERIEEVAVRPKRADLTVLDLFLMWS